MNRRLLELLYVPPIALPKPPDVGRTVNRILKNEVNYPRNENRAGRCTLVRNPAKRTSFERGAELRSVRYRLFRKAGQCTEKKERSTEQPQSRGSKGVVGG